MPSQMNQYLHKVIVQSILEVSKDGLQTSLPSVPRGFMYTLDLIIEDLLKNIIIYPGEGVAPGHIRVGEARSEANRLARRPETPVVDSWLIWHGGWSESTPGCWWVSCSFKKTIDFVEKVFQDPDVSRVCCLHNITWGTFLRHLRFISKNSEGWIPSIVEGECEWEDHAWNVKNHLFECWVDVGHPVSNQRKPAPEYWTQKFNTEENDKVIGMNPDWRFKLGYLVPVTAPEANRILEYAHQPVPAPGPAPGPAPEPEPDALVTYLLQNHPRSVNRISSEPAPVPEPTQTEINNESLKKLQEIIEAAAEKSEINEGEYLQLAKSLQGFYVSQ